MIHVIEILTSVGVAGAVFVYMHRRAVAKYAEADAAKLKTAAETEAARVEKAVIAEAQKVL